MTLQLAHRVIFFATNNVNKFNEVREILAPFKMAVGMLRIKSSEIQSESLEEIAAASVVEAFGKSRLPIVVEDAGLFVQALNGFPGPYAAYVYRTIGNEGLLKLMEQVEDRKAKFESVVAYFSAQLTSPKCFDGTVSGKIIHEERKSNNGTAFGFDPIFKPDRNAKTFAQMNVVEKCKRSHRAEAFRKFAEWYRYH